MELNTRVHLKGTYTEVKSTSSNTLKLNYTTKLVLQSTRAIEYNKMCLKPLN